MIHGTRGGYRRHLIADETACDACNQANNLHSQVQWRRHHPPPTTLADRITDVAATHEPVAVTELAALLPDANPDSLRRTVHRMLNGGTLVRMNGIPLTIGTP